MNIYKTSNELVYSTVRINCTLKNGELTTGTGFFCELERTEEGAIIVIVTNKHVVEDAIFGEIEFPIFSKGVEDYDSINLNDFETKWIMHPDENIDLCVLPVAEYIDVQEYEKNDKRIGFAVIPRVCFPSEVELKGLGAIEDIIMIGYPDGIMDEVNLSPIVRKGITATNVNNDYEDNPEFLIDIAVFEGSSGSPVLIYNQGVYIGDNGNPMIGTRQILLGVLYSGFDKNISGELVKTKIKNMKISSIKIPLNLGIVVKANKILDFIEELKKE